MKKLLFTFCFILAATQLAQAQLDFGVKGGINYNFYSFTETTDDVIDGNPKSKAGYHAGIWVQFKLPVVGYYIRPELVYTSLKSEVNLKNTPATQVKTSYDFQKIDIPILVGTKLLKVAYAHIGPSFQYIINGDLDFDAVTNINTNGFTVGLQLGGGIELGKLGIDARWERTLYGVESQLTSNISAIGKTNNTTNFKTEVNQIIVGLSYQF